VKLMIAGLLCLTLGRAAGERVVWAEAGTNLLGAPSRDGRWLSHVDAASGELALRDLKTGETRILKSSRKGSGEFAYFSVISPDSQRVAYAWFNEERFYELRAIGVDGAGERVLYRNEEAGFVQPCAWSPDGKQILTLLFRKDNISQIALVSADGGAARVLKSLNWIYPNRMDFSPDGRTIVYDNVAGMDGRRDIFALSVDGSRETPLVTGKGNDIFPLWRGDGKAVLYVSDEAGTVDIWEQPLAGGSQRLIVQDAGRVLAMGLTTEGEYYFGKRAGSVDVWVADLELGTPVKVSTNLAGVNLAPDWSPDGKQLAWLTRLGSENFGQESRVLSVADLQTRRQRVLEVKLAHMERVRWSPDGKQLLVSGSDRQNRRGLYAVDAETGEARGLVQERAGTYHGLEGVWTKEGDIIYLGEGIRLRQLAGGQERVLFQTDAGKLGNLELSRDGKWLAFTVDSKVMVVEAGGGAPRQVASLRGGKIEGLDWSPDSTALLLSAPPTLWRAHSGTGHVERLDARLDQQDSVRLHPDGKRVAYAAGKVREEVWVVKLDQRNASTVVTPPRE